MSTRVPTEGKPRPQSPRALLAPAGIALGCFLFAALVEGSHPGEAAVAATAVVGTVGPAGSDSLAGELGSMLGFARSYIGGLSGAVIGR